MMGNPPVKVAGGLGRPFGGSGLSKYPLTVQIQASQILGSQEYIRTAPSLGRPG